MIHIRQGIPAFFMLIVFIVAGCSTKANAPGDAPGTPSVSREQAVEIAKTAYKLNQIDEVTIRLLERWELEARPPEAYSPHPVYYVISGMGDKNQNVYIFVSSQDPERHFEIIDHFKRINVNLIASEKVLPRNYDDIAFRRQTVPYYDYLMIKAENKAPFARIWNDYKFSRQIPSVDFTENQVFLITVRESSSCPYELGDVTINPEGTEMGFRLVSEGGICTSDASPRTYVIEVRSEDAKNVTDAVIMEAGTKTKFPIYKG